MDADTLAFVANMPASAAKYRLPDWTSCKGSCRIAPFFLEGYRLNDGQTVIAERTES
jgi:hypothetical protein